MDTRNCDNCNVVIMPSPITKRMLIKSLHYIHNFVKSHIIHLIVEKHKFMALNKCFFTKRMEEYVEILEVGSIALTRVAYACLFNSAGIDAGL